MGTITPPHSEWCFKALRIVVYVGVCAVSFASFTSGQLLTHDLAAEKWTVTNSNASIQLDIEIPGYALEALEKHNVIPDPLHRYGEQELRWVALDSWSFQSTFNVSKDFQEQSNVDLILSGIDTVADVTLNGRHIASLSNFHRQYRLPVQPALVPGPNTLQLLLSSSILYERAAQQAYPYPLPSAAAPHQLGTWPYLRKTASDGGWDWGPAFAPQGIAGMVELHAYSSPYLAGIHVQQLHHHDNSTTSLVVESEIALPVPAAGHTSGGTGGTGSTGSTSFSGTLTVSLPELEKLQQWLVEVQPGSEGSSVFVSHTLELSHDELELWWPWELGNPKLYNLTVTFTPQCTAAAVQVSAQAPPAPPPPPPSCSRSLDPCHLRPRPADPSQPPPSNCPPPPPSNSPTPTPQCPNPCTTTLTRKIGFRDIELVTDPLPDGETYYFRVNGVAIFMRGANFIPMAIVPTNVTTGDMDDLLSDAKAAHMNMIRVWGGGFYQRQSFYELCDEKGLLVWQEAMFACAAYPRSPEFLKEVSEEIKYQVRRLAYHPSIAIWGGNNEVENSFEWFDATKSNQRLYGVDYQVLFLEVVGKLITRLDPARPYVDSSPSNGLLVPRGMATERVKRWGSTWEPQYGDIHFYNYNDDCQDPSIYPKAKFVSEFGFQSFPSFRTLAGVTGKEDWAVDSDMSGYRQRHPDGNSQLQAQLKRHFRLPFAWGAMASEQRNASLFKTWIFLTQVQQAGCYEAALGRWRAYVSDPSACTMGVLYWQLNDIWQGPSWSSINRDGRWKMVHHAVKRVFDNGVLHAMMNKGELQVYALNSRPAGLVGTLEIWVHRWNDTASECGTLYRRLVLPTRASGSDLLFSLGQDQLQGGFPSELVEAGFTPYRSFLSFTYQYSLGYSTRRPLHDLSQPPCLHATPPTPSPFSTPTPAPIPFQSKLSTQQKRWTSDRSIRKTTTFFFPLPFSQIQLPNPAITLTDFAQLNATHVGLTVSSSLPAVWVFLQSSVRGNFDSNGFTLVPCRPQRVLFKAATGVALDVKEFEAGVKAESLYDHQCLDY